MERLTAPLRVVIADDSTLLRSGVARLLRDEGMEILSETDDTMSLLEAVDAHRPDVPIVDLRMPPTFTDEGIRAAFSIRRSYPDMGVLVLSQWVDQESANEFLRRGSRGIGYLLKDQVTDIDAFADAVRRVAAGGSALDPEVVSQLLSHGRGQNSLEALSPREAEVLAHMAEGLSNTAIAQQMDVTDRAVEKHIRSIFTKLELPPDEQEHNRRVVAVLRYLNARTGNGTV